MRLLVRSWTLYHGRTHPPTSKLHLEQMVRLVTADAPDLVALQEVPLWAVRRLEAWSGMQASWAMTMPALLGPLARHVTDADPQRFRSSLTGQANALLVNPHFEPARHRRIVLNPDLSRTDRLLGAHSRVCHALEVDSRGGRLLAANLHASNDPDPLLVGVEIDRAASFLAGPSPVCSAATSTSASLGARLQRADRGRRPDPRPRLRARTRARELARGATADARGRALGPRARRGGDRMDLVAVRAGLPVLERFAYLNAGTFGPLPRATVEAMEEVQRRELETGRSNRPYFEQALADRERLREAFAGLIGAGEGCIALTTSTTEGCNIAIGGLGIGPGDEVVTTDSEHPGLFGGLVASGATLRIAAIRDLPAKELLPALEAQITPRTRLVAVSHVSWLTGVVLPVAELAGRGIPLLVDGAQAAGTIPVDVRDLGCDFYTVSAQKWLLGPAAVGRSTSTRIASRTAVSLPLLFSWQLSPGLRPLSRARPLRGRGRPSRRRGVLASLRSWPRRERSGTRMLARPPSAWGASARAGPVRGDRRRACPLAPGARRSPNPSVEPRRGRVVVRGSTGTGFVRAACGFGGR